MTTSIVVNEDNAFPSEEATFRWLAIASELQFPVGKFPTRINTTLGNGQPFIRAAEQQLAPNEVIYRQEFGCVELYILND
jgi:hypothetical protein